MRGLKLLALLAGLVLAGCERGSVSEAAADVRAAASSQSARSATAELNLRRLQVASERYAELLAREPIVWEKMAIAARQAADAWAGLSPHVTATPTRAAMETAINHMNDAARSKDPALARRASAAERTLRKSIAATLAKPDSAPR